MTKQPDMNKIGEIIAAADADDKAKEEAQQKEASKHPQIIPELRDLLDTLSDDSKRILEKQLLDEGIRDALVVWKEKNAIIDGHNRLELAKKHNLPYRRDEKSFPDIKAVRAWMIENQLGRRNLSPDRFTYFLGTLYNEEKQNEVGTVGGPREKSEDGKTTADKIGDKFGVSGRTVRRAGDVALGIDKLEQVRGRLAKTQQLDGKGDYSNEELKEIGKTKSTKVADIMLRKLDESKVKKAAQKEAVKRADKAAAKAPVKYPVAFAAPDFDALSYSAASQPKPPMADDFILYVHCLDHQVAQAVKLIEKWGLDYEGSFVFWGSNTESASYSKLVHEFLLIGTKGTVIGPKKGKEVNSVQKVTGRIADHMVKLVETYHPDVKRLDLRKDTAPGWDARP